MSSVFCGVEQGIEEIKKGKMLILIDHQDRENEGDFFIPAQLATTGKINFMITYGKGLVCVPITADQAKKLGLSQMVSLEDNQEYTRCNFTISVDAKKGIKTGISAHDRAKTIKVLSDPDSTHKELVKPGHVFPLIADEGGSLSRNGHTEAAVELSRLSGMTPVGVICEIINKEGKMASMSELTKLAEIHQLKILAIENLIDLQKVASSLLPTKYGIFKLDIFQQPVGKNTQVVLSLGRLKKNQPVLTRMHSQCLTGESFLSLKCDCGQQLHQAMKMIAKQGSGVIIYLDQEGRGIGLIDKIKAYSLQEKGLDTVEANEKLGFESDERDYQIAAELLIYLGISKVSLMTNNPDKVRQLKSYGIKVVKQVPLEIIPNGVNRDYLETKKKKMKHKLELV